LHDKNMLLMIGVNRTSPVKKTWKNDREARQRMVADLKRRAAEVASVSGGSVDEVRIVLVHEASGLGWVLHDELVAAGIECHVLAPTGIERSLQHVRRKTDERDAQRLLDMVRGHVFAGSALPSVWVPDAQTRDDREVVRARQRMTGSVTAAKCRIRCLLKRFDLAADFAGWTKDGRAYLEQLIEHRLGFGAASALAGLLRELDFAQDEIVRLDAKLKELASEPRHATVLSKVKHKGVGPVTSLVFLTEIGPMSRFQNRRQFGSFLGLTPRSNESGQCGDRKGRITRQGPARIRRVLCQAVWSRILHDESERLAHAALVRGDSRRKRLATVARMRQLGIRLWHDYGNAQAAAIGPPAPPSARRRRARRQPPPTARQKIEAFLQAQPA
jgi:transposase